MLDVLIIFTSSFFSVFALGFQSLNVNQGRYVSASLTSIVICTGSLFILRGIPTASVLPILAYYVGCNLGILAGMWSHPRIKVWLAALNRRWTEALARRRLRQAIARHKAELPPRPNPTEPPRGWPADIHDTH